MELPIYVYGTEVLREKTREVTEEEFPSLGKLIENMFETMYASDGVGSVSYTHLLTYVEAQNTLFIIGVD